jgi:hydrogenase maturation protein HypF
MVADYLGFERAGSLRYTPMPGGDKATEEPFRMAISYLYSLYGEDIPPHFLKRWGEEKVLVILRMIKEEINSPLTSSAGRLFDAVSSLIGLRDVVDYEAQAAVELEMIADSTERERYGFDIIVEDGLFIIDPLHIILGIIKDMEVRKDPPTISSKFHNTVLAFIIELCKRIREAKGIEKVVLSGGVFQNRYLLERIVPVLGEEGFLPLIHSSIPPNDGGISLGQVVIANKRVGG